LKGVLTELEPDVYQIDLPAEAEPYRAHLFDGPSPTLVDTGSAETVDTLRADLDALGVRPERVLITHADFDHVGGLEAVVDHYDPETWVPEQSTLSGSVEPDHRFGHGDVVAGFTAVHAPGHVDDNHAFVNERDSIAVLGDVLIGSDRRGLPPGYFLLPEAIYSNDLIAAERHLERLLEHDFEVGLVSHGSSVLEDAREKLEAFVEFPAKPEWPAES
jgi:glyoxylase-like metal-dependent hydrolase (beta-lactamase superfamily II)